MSVPRVCIIGTGGMGRETLWILREAARTGGYPEITVEGFLTNETDQHGTKIHGADVLGDESWLASHPDVTVLCAVGDPRSRIALVRRVESHGVAFTTAVHPSAVYPDGLAMGPGTIIGAHSTVTVDVAIGSHVIINSNVSISHDCHLEDFATLAPGVVLTGRVRVGYGAELGANCTVLPRVSIGRGALVGAGAVVARDVPPNTVVAGVPAKVLRAAAPEACL